MDASDAVADVGEAVIAALHPFAALGTSGGFDRGAGRLDMSSRTLRVSPDLLCKLSSLTRIKCDNRVNVSRVKKASTTGSTRRPRRSRSTFPEAPRLGNALAGRPKWAAGRRHRETRSGAW
jgi:hypothetical protein